MCAFVKDRNKFHTGIPDYPPVKIFQGICLKAKEIIRIDYRGCNILEHVDKQDIAYVPSGTEFYSPAMILKVKQGSLCPQMALDERPFIIV